MKILIATDGSNFSKAAIEACRKFIADPENTSVKIIAALEYPMPLANETVAVSAEYYNLIEQAERRRATEFAQQAAAQIRSLFPDVSLDLTTEVIEGSPQRVIVEKAQSWGADLIVIGSHGYGFWSRALIGSVSSSVVHHAPCSVLVVRPPAQDSNELA